MSVGLIVGVALAVASFAYVLHPLVTRREPGPRAGSRGAAVAAGAVADPPRDVTDEEIETAIRSYRGSQPGARVCAECGPRPEADALFCSSCGRALDG